MYHFSRLINVLHNLAATLGTTPEWLATGAGDAPDIEHIQPTITLPLIPVITHAQAFSMPSKENIVGFDYIPAPERTSPQSFALKIEGHSMQSDGLISFPEGSIVIFDPTMEPHHNDFVLCKLSNYDAVTFSRL